MLNSKGAENSVQSNPFTFCFVEETGRNADRRTRNIIYSHAAREARRRRRLEQQKRLQEKNTASQVSVPKDLIQASEGHAHLEYYESTSKCQMISTVSLVGDLIQSDYQRGNMHTFDISLFRRMLDQNFPSLLSTSIGAVFDPFGSTAELSPLLSSLYLTDVNALKSHAIDFCFPGDTRSVVFPEALRTPALLGSILYMAYANLSSLRGWDNPELALALKTATISHVNKKLSRPDTATCTSVIASIAYLSTGTWIFGNDHQETATHLTGIQLMVQKRGMRNLGKYPFGQIIQKYLYIQHAVMQAMSAQPSHYTFNFDYDIGSGSLESTTYMPEVSPKYICNTFMILRNSKTPNEQTTSILVSTKSLMDLLLAQHEERESRGDEETFSLQFSVLRSQIKSHLSASDPLCPCYGDFIYESCRLSCIVVVEAIERRKPLNQVSQLLISCLANALEKTDVSNTWGDMLGVLYWVSMIGSAAWKGRGGPGEKMLGSTLGSAMFKATFENKDLGCAIRPARLFGRLQIALKRRCKMLVPR